ncbi:hypothetical protein [Zavarzinella formosa]|uniref:hypothetical protein n=1 Tax=Zavarzinella formosa TaxID=360055 RepID=UPI00036F161F|nr:hypothetical protein [Zavarzinella formosa]
MNVYASRNDGAKNLSVSNGFWRALAAFATAWAVLVPGVSQAQTPEDTEREKGMWVLVKYLDANRPVTINGFVQKTQYESLLSGEVKGFVKLDHVFWKKDDGFYYQEQEDAEFGRERFRQVRAGFIYEVQPLKDDYVKKAFSKEERDKAANRSKKPSFQGLGNQGIP